MPRLQVRLLLEQEHIEVGATNARGETPLHLAMGLRTKAHAATGTLVLLLEHCPWNTAWA